MALAASSRSPEPSGSVTSRIWLGDAWRLAATPRPLGLAGEARPLASGLWPASPARWPAVRCAAHKAQSGFGEVEPEAVCFAQGARDKELAS